MKNNKRSNGIHKNYMKKGFTLIEILIVVAIIAILASVVLVGLGPTQRAGRDARRIADLRTIQNGLELYYNKCGYYPGPTNAAACAAWATTNFSGMSSALTGSTLGITAVPNDPSAGKTYYFGSYTNGSTYTLGAVLEDGNNAVFNNYTAPPNVPTGLTSCTKANSEYCVTL